MKIPQKMIPFKKYFTIHTFATSQEKDDLAIRNFRYRKNYTIPEIVTSPFSGTE